MDKERQSDLDKQKSIDSKTASNRPHKDKNILSSLNRALKIMDLLSVRSDLGVTEISRITGYDKASVYKMLYTMQHRGYVIKTDGARYSLSSKLSANSGQTLVRQNIVDAAAPYIRRLRDDCRETVLLGVLNINGKVIFTCKEEGLSPESIRTRTAYEIDAYTNAAGKILLANLDEPMLKSILSNIQVYPHTPDTVPDERSLLSQLADLKGASCAEQYDENYVGHSDIAAPIRGENGRCIATLSIACPTDVLKQKRETFLPLLLDTARALSADMGWKEA